MEATEDHITKLLFKDSKKMNSLSPPQNIEFHSFDSFTFYFYWNRIEVPLNLDKNPKIYFLKMIFLSFSGLFSEIEYV